MAFAPARTSSRRPPGVHRSRAFTLIEIVVVLFIGGVLLAMAAALTRGVVTFQKRSLTATRMAGAEAALIQFVQQQRRLPCPGDGALASTDNNAGTEGARNAAGCTGDQTSGVLPWRALALTEAEATDGWDRRITYRIDPVLAADGRLDMSRCDPAGSAAVGGAPNYCQACTSATVATCTRPDNFLNNRGLKVQNVAGTVVMDPSGAIHSGAAFVLISHGESGGGARMGSGQLSQSTVTDGTEEAKNYANLAVRLPPALYYVDDALSEASGATHFDDVILRPSLLGVITRAGLGPRPQP